MPKNIEVESDNVPLDPQPEPRCRIGTLSNRTKCILCVTLTLSLLALFFWPKAIAVSFPLNYFIKILSSDENSIKFDFSTKTFAVSSQIPLDISNSNYIPLKAHISANLYYPGDEGFDGVLMATSDNDSLDIPALGKTTVNLDLNAHVAKFSEGVRMSTQFTLDCGACALKTKANCLEETDFFIDALVEPDYFGFGRKFPLTLTIPLPCASIYPY
ncbi:hypothetical protein TrST_g4068 [Triparma strigata]|uniref:Uncharacterized protein n=1 Tax=Triparma strigata TaxID=1606541 RepID=A0A9W7BPA0_9STRA|nr:hypothetical protein TrST_g4068 [Triparma strigata]